MVRNSDAKMYRNDSTFRALATTCVSDEYQFRESCWALGFRLRATGSD